MNIGIGIGIGIGTGRSFSPSSIAGMSFRASAKQFAFNDDGVTLATDGQTVLRWNDLSSNANNAANSGAATGRPTYRSSGGPSSLATLEFDGADALALGTLLTGASRTAFFVCNKTAVGSSYQTLLWGSGFHILYRMATAGDLWGAWQLSEVPSTVTLDSEFVIICVRQTAIQNTDFIKNGVLENSTAGSGSPSASSSVIGAGAFPVINQGINGKISELIVYDTALSNSDITLVQNFLNQEWGGGFL